MTGEAAAKSKNVEQVPIECKRELRKQKRWVHTGKDLSSTCRKGHREEMKRVTTGVDLSPKCKAEFDAADPENHPGKGLSYACKHEYAALMAQVPIRACACFVVGVSGSSAGLRF